MKVWYNLQVIKLIIICQKLGREAKKLAVAVVIAEYVLVGGFYFVEKQGIIEMFQAETYVVHNQLPKIAKAQSQELPKNNIDVLADKIWMLESTKGKHNFSKCQATGQVNGIGYGIYGQKWQCFESHEKEMQVLKQWLRDKQAKGMTETEMLCVYNTGSKEMCEYAKLAQKLN